MLDQPAAEYGSEVIPAPEIGKRIVNTPFGQIKVDWPEDPRIKVIIPDNYSDAAQTRTAAQIAYDNMPDYQKDEASAQRMKDQAIARTGTITTPTVSGGGAGGSDGGGAGGGNDDSIDPPRPPKQTKTKVPGTSSEFLSMPDLSKVIDDEIKRLTLSIIEDGKDLILSKTVNYKSIDFIPEVEVQINPPQKRINFIRDQFNDIARAVQRNINKSKKAYTNVYNYGEYLDFFEVRYNRSDGRPVVTFKINLEDFNLSELSVVNLRRTG